MKATIAVIAPSLDILGGQGIQARALADRLTADGHHVSFVAINPRFPSALRWLRRIRGLRTIVNELFYVPGLVRLWRANVVHVFSASYWSFLLGPAAAIIVARALGKRVVLNYHSGEADDHLANWGWLVHPWLRFAHEIVVPSRYLQGVFARYGYATRVIPNIVDLRRLPYRERAMSGPRLVTTRNLERHYGIDVVLRAFARIKRRCSDATLTIAGSGREERRLVELAESLGVDGVRFVGRQQPAELIALCASADVFVNASVIDNQPISVLEAFALGLPVVSTPTGDLAHMLGNNARGCVVPAGDAAALADAVMWVIENAAERVQMTRRARAYLEAHTWSNVRDAWMDVYIQGDRRVRAAENVAYVPETR